jgi:hypothetical protein|tara:strand:+ start:170 stop:607 length:438 start_codon:yes stop_codon:yes gene_type:complete
MTSDLPGPIRDHIESIGAVDRVGYLDLPRSYLHGIVIALFQDTESLKAKSIIYLAGDRQKVEGLQLEGQPIGDVNLPATTDLDSVTQFYMQTLGRKDINADNEKVALGEAPEEGHAYLQTYRDQSPEMFQEIDTVLSFLTRWCHS